MVVPFYMWLSRLIWAFNMGTYRIITDSMGYSMAFMVEKLGGSSWVTECFMARLGGSSSSSMGRSTQGDLLGRVFGVAIPMAKKIADVCCTKILGTRHLISPIFNSS